MTDLRTDRMPRLVPGVHFVISALLTLSAAFTHASIAADVVKPNVLVILADDLGYGDVSCNNPDRGKLKTPNIDRLAAQGMRFTDAHSSSGVCSPSRYALLTGRYHWRTSLQSGIVGVWGKPLIAPGRMTIASLAKKQGYRTACVGKWHLGRDWPIPEDQRSLFTNFGPSFAGVTDEHRRAWAETFAKPIPGGPTSRGFDAYFGTDVPNWPPYCFIDNDRTVGIPDTVLGQEQLRNHQASIQGPAVPGWRFEPILPTLGDKACEFIRTSAEAKQPFLLYLPLTTPHTPLSPNEAWKGKSGLGNAAADLILETDALVGRVLDALDESGTTDQTLVLFTSDNGFAPYVGAKDLEKQGHYPSGPLRGYKSDVYEGGHRVPFIVRWPGVVKPGAMSGQLVHHADVIRTLAEIWGIELPDDAGEDSFSLLPILKGNDVAIRTNAVSCAASGIPGYREGNRKLILAPDPATKSPVQLYDLTADLGETKNLAAAEPHRAAAMKAAFETIISQGRSTPGKPQANDVPVRRFPRPADAPPKKAETKRAAAEAALPPAPEIVGPWNVTELKKAPSFRWLSENGPVRSLLYSGEKYRGRETEVFAFYASPATLGEAPADAKFPGVVLIHGGGGTAFAEWAWLWAKRGYAAIAMDLSGSRPIDPIYDAAGVPVPNQSARPDTRTRLPNGGPEHGHTEKFDSIGGDVSDDWPYHAVASVMRAHSLLRSFPDVIADRTAVTGISWGGYTTCLVASVDDRFRAAVPVYGCGFLFEGESVQKPLIDRLGVRRSQWIDAYDPSSWLSRCRVPILFVNGTNDVHYVLDSYRKSYDLVPGPKQVRIEVNMPHGHPPGWAPKEIGLFIDSFCREGQPLPVPGRLRVENSVVRLPYASASPIKTAALHFTTDVGLRSNRTWKSLPAKIGPDAVTAPGPPSDANTWFIALTDERGAMVTSEIQMKP
jgi:arylsulfatase A-like enzyme/dienelactone hydrolase